MRLEKENSSLMAKAFAAPSTALVELRGLKSEVYSLRRDKANAELREAEARRELADLTSRVSTHACCGKLEAVTNAIYLSSVCLCCEESLATQRHMHQFECYSTSVYQDLARGNHRARERAHMWDVLPAKDSHVGTTVVCHTWHTYGPPLVLHFQGSHSKAFWHALIGHKSPLVGSQAACLCVIPPYPVPTADIGLSIQGSRHEGQPADMLRMQQELTASHKLVAHLKIELDAAHGRLDIFRLQLLLFSTLSTQCVSMSYG